MHSTAIQQLSRLRGSISVGRVALGCEYHLGASANRQRILIVGIPGSRTPKKIKGVTAKKYPPKSEIHQTDDMNEKD